MVELRTIVLDSSVIGTLTRHLAGDREKDRHEASQFLSFLTDNDLVPLVTAHHICEILQHENDAVVDQRLAFLQGLPLVAWLDSINPPGQIGSIVDVRAAEVHVLLNDRDTPCKRVVATAKAQLLRKGSGKDFGEIFLPLTCREARDYVRQGIEQKREIASIDHARSCTGMEGLKWSDLINGRARNRAEMLQALQTLAIRLQSTLQSKGDKKLASPTRTAFKFIRDLPGYGRALASSREHPAIQIVKDVGIDPSELEPDTPVEDILNRAVFVDQLHLLSRTLDVDYGILAGKIREGQCPSWIMWRELSRASQSAARASGSDLHDRYLATFCLYADVTTVDKRTYQYLRQAQRSNLLLGELSGAVVKVSEYDAMKMALSDALR